MTTNIIERKICLESEYLDANIFEHLLKKIKDSTLDECSKEYGHFMGVKKIKNIKDNSFSSNCENVFLVEFEVETLKPEIDNKYTGKVCMIFSGGIFIIFEKIKILIPQTSLNDYEFDTDNNCFTNKETNKIIKQNDEITAIITGVQYNKKKFSCVGKIFE